MTAGEFTICTAVTVAAVAAAGGEQVQRRIRCAQRAGAVEVAVQ